MIPEGAPTFPPLPAARRRALITAMVLAGLLFGWVVLIGRADVTPAPTSDFYDLQARAWLHGRWDIEDHLDPKTHRPVSPLSIEAIVVDGKKYLYYGPVPALLRVPVLALTDERDGRLTQPFMLVAFLVSLAAVANLDWRIRVLARGRAEERSTDLVTGQTRSRSTMSRAEAEVSGLVVLAVGAGSVLLYLGSQPTVYHEAILWGVAFSLWSYRSILEVAVRPATRPILLSGTFATLALLSRASVGLGPVVALGLLLLLQLVRLLRRREGVARPATATMVGLAAAMLVPIGFYAAVNEARFGELFRLPLEKQVFSHIDPNRRAALAHNDGSLFGAKFVPSTLLQYARPDALEVDDLAPWINFPRSQATIVGDVVFDTRDETSSLPASMPVWMVLAVMGLVAVIRPPPTDDDGPTLAALRLPLLGAVAGTVPTLTIAFIANRYLGDFLPLLVLAGLAGLHLVGLWWRTARRAPRVAVVTGLAVLALWGVATNLALAIEYQRLIAPVDPSTRSAFVALQYTWGGAPSQVPRVASSRALPADPGERGDLFVIGPDADPCRRVVWSDGFGWRPLPRKAQVCDALGVDAG